jgi:PTS system nitrogen regulatory IIA component
MDNKVQKALEREIMTLSEVAAYLKLAEKTVLRMAHKGEIPCAKIASQWRFLKPMIDNWLLSKMKCFNRENELGSILIEEDRAFIPVTRLLHQAFVVCGLKSGSKKDVLKQLIQPLLEARIISEGEGYLNKLLAREQLLSTALGKGIAIPHIRNPKENPPGITLIVVGICKEGTDFGSLDDKATNLFFLLCTDSVKLHLRILVQLNRIINDDALVQKLLKVPDEQSVVELIAAKEKELFKSLGV